MKPLPVNSRVAWHKYYVNRFNKTGKPECAQLAMWYHFLHLAFDNPKPTHKYMFSFYNPNHPVMSIMITKISKTKTKQTNKSNGHQYFDTREEARQYCDEVGIPQKMIIDNGRYTSPKGMRWMV